VKKVKCLAFLISPFLCFFAIAYAYAELKERDPALVISVEKVLQKLKEKREIILIDVRNSKEYEQFRIPGSINIPLFAIKTKIFLKTKPLVLINEGHSYSQLEQEGRSLRDSGFTVSILNGGLHHWKQKGAPLEGDVFAQRELNKISPQIFFTEKDYENWIVIDVSQSEESEAYNLFPHGIHIPYSDEPEQFISKLKDIIGKRTGDPFLSILICDENGEHYEKIEKLIQKASINSVLYLKGGIEGYRTFLQQQVSIWKGKGNTRKTVKKCTSCP
jgi:rhodanese-related sulfurtransferase